MTVTALQYFTNPTSGVMKPHTEGNARAFEDLNDRVERLVDEAVSAGRFTRRVDPDTRSEISGKKGGTGGGGFRDKWEEGAPNSSHKEARAEDRFDPMDELDKWLDEFETGDGGNTKLEEYGLYREHPDDTPGWCHLTTRAPGSGRRTFKP